MNPQTVNRLAYQRPFPKRIISEYPLPRNYRPPDFYSFSGEDGSSTIEHVGRFTAQLGEVGNNQFHKLQLFGWSLTRTAFSCLTHRPPGNQANAGGFIERIRLIKRRCPIIIEESEMTNLVVRNMHTRLREALTAHDVQDLTSLASKAGRLESLFREKDHNFRQMASVDTKMYTPDDEQGECAEEMVVEIVNSKPYVCFKLKPLPGAEEQEQPTFDASKADEIFDILLADGPIRIPKGQRLATKDEIKGRPYCKWHNSFTHYTNQCTHF
ncbi:uncharacterized protein LOC127242557 [Andrographis paniculata]|uniref:uncharacterized protein LOC127242557 n=1 Tax=Andrographis paniculata TaxID=175694 RepID=UPI0021E7EEDA|nr:uncharacterized protein LOC127242557 [Andrographis paniculata]